MKKILTISLIIAALLTGMRHKHYAVIGTITALDHTRDIVTFTDNYGHMWDMYGCDDYDTGDQIAVVMSDHGTPDNRYDDVIISARYIG